MRTIIIEPVPNGWIVSEKHNVMECLSPVLGVYTDLGSLQAAIPVLLEARQEERSRMLTASNFDELRAVIAEEKKKLSTAGFAITNAALKEEERYQKSLRKLRESCRPDGNFEHGDRTSETIGGNELTPSS